MLQNGQTLGKFTVVRQLGSGGMGEVYLAEDSQLHRQVALKILHNDMFGDKERMERFYREARSAARVAHANVMAIFDLESATSQSGQDITYIVMEFVQGESLTQWIGKSKHDLASVVRTAEKIASGLAAAHKMNIVHRDIKSENIIMTESGEPKILDFGLAKALESELLTKHDTSTRTVSRELTKAGKILGTVSYMSPEQARGEALDARSDIFSFGVLLYRMATGEFPFIGTTDVSTLAKILEVPHDSPRTKNVAIPAEFERIIDKCLKKAPSDRYQSTDDLVVDLRDLRRQIDSGVTQAISRPVDIPPQKTMVMQMGWKGIAAVVVAVAAITVIWNSYDSNDGSVVQQAAAVENGLAVIGFENKTGDTNLDWMESGLPEILLTDLSQSTHQRIVSEQRLRDALKSGRGKSEFDYDDYISAARTLRITHLLSGSYFKVGDQVRIDARVEDVATGNISSAFKVVGSDPFGLVDSLAIKISASMNLATRGAVNASAILSSSPEAYRRYLTGMEYFRIADYEHAVPEFLAAVAEDSTFALPYMRLGMANAFQGRQKPAADYLRQAQIWQQKLPSRERALLDIYADAWLRTNWRDAYTKLDAFVNQYPDDKEALALHGTFVFVFTSDTARAIQSFDAALEIDPEYPAAWGGYLQMYSRLGKFAEAVKYAERIRDAAPNAKAGHIALAELYTKIGDIDAALREYHTVLSLSPHAIDALEDISYSFIAKRQFDSSRYYVEFMKIYHSDDLVSMRKYHNLLANIDKWEGKFLSALKKHFKALEYTMRAHDSADIALSYLKIANDYERMKNIDSALYYSGLNYRHNTTGLGSGLNHAYMLAQYMTDRPDSADAIFKQAIDETRSRIPQSAWGLIDALELLYKGTARHDTAMIIQAMTKLYDPTINSSPENTRELARMLIAHGKFKEGLLRYDSAFARERIIGSGYEYPIYLYYAGIAHQELGNRDKARELFEEMLSYWGKPEFEYREIKDARERLKKLKAS